MSSRARSNSTLWEQRRLLLTAVRLPFSLSDVEAGFYLGFTAAEIGTLVAEKMLTAQGNPPPQAPKHFTTAHIEERGQDEKWMDKARKFVRLNRKDKNDRDRAKKNAVESSSA